MNDKDAIIIRLLECINEVQDELENTEDKERAIEQSNKIIDRARRYSKDRLDSYIEELNRRRRYESSVADR